MVIYKILRAEEWADMQDKGVTAGAPVDLADGYIHFSTPAQAVETAAKHFAGLEGLILVAVDAAHFGDDLRWDVSRGGARFPHLYRPLRTSDVIWSRPLPLTGSVHHFPTFHRVYKIFTAKEWDVFSATASWAGSTLDLGDGFIHLSGPLQVPAVLAHFFEGVEGLTLGTIDLPPDEPHIRWEDPGNGDLFPHLYRALRPKDVTESHVIALQDGVHTLAPPDMSVIEQIGLRALRGMDPERAHGLALAALNAGLGPRGGPVTSDRLRTNVAGLDLPNPVGLAAGFDKNATALAALSKTGFGFLEVGAATPLPQPGNPKPRLFRLTEDQAAINRFGFNNDGMVAIGARLAGHTGIVGLNLGANKTSEDRAGDFAKVLAHCGPHVDFATVNVSSPNTEKLRDLQGKAALAALLAGVMDANSTGIPVFLKIAPDLTPDEIGDVADVANASGIAGIIATNTTLDRDGLHGPHRAEAGGLSGQPVFEKSTRVLAQLAGLTELPLIGVGGVGSAAQAYAKILAGASAVQLYTALVYGGISLAGDIARGLDRLLARDGFASVADAVGKGRHDLDQVLGSDLR